MTDGTQGYRDARDATKVATRQKRHNKKNRIAPWDNFQARNKADDEAAAKEKEAERRNPPLQT